MNDMRSPVTVIAVTHNSADVLPRFLAALPSASITTEYRLAVADNDSADDSVKILTERAPDALVIQSGANVGFAAGINLILSTVQPVGHVLVVNPDVQLQPGSLDALISAAEAPSVGIVVPQLRNESGRLLFSLRRDPHLARVFGEALLGGVRAGRYWLGEMVTAPGEYENPRSADWATGACMLITAECLKWVERWDDSFFLYSEETEYALRARAAGFILLYTPEARAIHRGGEVHQSPQLFALLTLNRWRLYRRLHGRFAGSIFRFALVVDAAPRALVGRSTSRAALISLLSPRVNPKCASVPAVQ